MAANVTRKLDKNSAAGGVDPMQAAAQLAAIADAQYAEPLPTMFTRETSSRDNGNDNVTMTMTI